MPTLVGVKLRFSPKPLFFNAFGTDPAEGDLVVVTTDRGVELGTVIQSAQEFEEAALPAALKSINRIANADDLVRVGELEVLEREAMPVVRRMISEHKLDMKPVDIEYLFGGDKVVVYFVAEERVDFRDLVKELASWFHARIDMRQVGVRDEARMVGGMGHCGQQLCCSRFGGDFEPVSIRMAKEQDLPLNPLKISGACGRLMCCLRYEFEAYKDYKSRAPKRGAIVETPLGLAKVANLDTPRETVDIRLEDGKRFTVALADMHCCKGGLCPCAVSREALEAADGTGAAAAFVAVEREAEARLRAQAAAEAPAPVVTGESQAEGGRKRRRRSSAKGGESVAASQTQEAAPAPVEKVERTGRRRRAPQQAPQQEAKPAGLKPVEAKQASGVTEPSGEPEAARSTRRRRRRRPGSAGSGTGGETPSAQGTDRPT